MICREKIDIFNNSISVLKDGYLKFLQLVVHSTLAKSVKMNAPEKVEEEDYEKLCEEIEHEIAGQNVGISVFKHIISKYKCRRYDIPTNLLLDWVVGDEVDPNYIAFKKKIDTNRRLHREELVQELSKNEAIEKKIKKVIDQYQSQMNRHAVMEKKRKTYHKELEEITYDLNFIYNNLIHCFIDKMTGYFGNKWREYDKEIIRSYEKDLMVENQLLSPFLGGKSEHEERKERVVTKFTPTYYPELICMSDETYSRAISNLPD